MRNFRENHPLVESIGTNDIKEIKRILIDNIFFLRGNLNEIENAITYAEENSDFFFDEHKAIKIPKIDDNEDYFSKEQWNMRENYSRERYDLLVRLYNQFDLTPDNDYKTEKVETNNKLIKNIVIGGSVLLAGYLLYKAFTNE